MASLTFIPDWPEQVFAIATAASMSSAFITVYPLIGSASLVIIEFDEWGNPTFDEDLEWMMSWSPYDKCPTANARPPLLTTTAINDSRVSFWEPARWVAKMRGDPDSKIKAHGRAKGRADPRAHPH